jgi:hypothetical protein
MRSIGSSGCRRRLLDLGGKTRKKKKLSVTQAYTKLYWEEKIAAVVEKRWKTKWLSEHPEYNPKDPRHRIPKAPIAFQNSVVRELYDSEPPEVVLAVAEHRDETGEQSASSDDDDERHGETAKLQRQLVAQQVYVCLYCHMPPAYQISCYR